MKKQLSKIEMYSIKSLKFFFFLLLFGVCQFSQAQPLTVGNNQTVTITSNTYYSSINVNNGGTLNVLAPAVLTVGTSGTLASVISVLFDNGSTFLLSSGATMIVNGTLENKNNSDLVQINGTLIVNGNVNGGGQGSVIFGSGTIATTGTISTQGTGVVFGTTSDCSPGPCSGTICQFSTANTITASGATNFCTNSNTSAIYNGSAITSATYQWESSASMGSGYSDIGGATAQDYTPPNNIVSTRYYRRKATITGCTQSSNIITVTISANPIISVQPTSAQTICVGNAATFNVVASGTGLTYQWRKAGVVIPGATNASYTIPSVLIGDAATLLA